MSAEMKVLFGPPGTGKTYEATREAVRIIDDAVPPDAEEARARHNELVREGRIFWVTFHPSYSYEDFVEGFRPHEAEGGDLIYRVKDGPFKLACAACRTWIRVGDRLGHQGRYEVVDIDAGGVVVRSEVTRANAITSYLEHYADFWTINRLREHGIAPEDISIGGTDNEQRQEVSRKTHLASTIFTGSGHLRAVYEALEEARQEKQAVVLVIDEINRADLSRVFGELITLIELDKREGAREETAVTLPYSQRRFSVPAELSILATMNTADKSLSVFDLALRRRFQFVEVPPRPELCPRDYGGIPVAQLLTEMNRRITAVLSADLRIGHADYMEKSLEAVRTSAQWQDADDARTRAVARVLRTKTVPLLQEYFHADWRKTNFVTGGALLEGESLADYSTALPEDLVMDLEDAEAYAPGDWWNPDSDEWDASRFTETLLTLVN